MIFRYGTPLGAVFAAVLVLSGAVVAAEAGEGATMTVEQAKNLPGVVSVTQSDGSIAYYKNYSDYNDGKPVAVEKAPQGTNAPAMSTTTSQSTSSSSIPPTPTKGSDDYYTVVGPNGMTAAEEDELMRSVPTTGYGGANQRGTGNIKMQRFGSYYTRNGQFK